MNLPAKMAHPLNRSEVKFTVVYDNNPYREDLQTDWGFSCHVQLSETAMLFDTGARGELLIENMRRLNLDPARVDTVFLSHMHVDHTGGLPLLIERNPRLNVCLPQTFPGPFKDMLRDKGIRIVETAGFTEIVPGVYSTGDLGGWLAEQSLIVHTDAGLVVITGCAHPGIVDTLKHVREIIEQEILLVLGGFHLEGENESELETYLSLFKILGVKQVAPCHCTGNLARKLFQNAYRSGHLEVGVGRHIQFSSDAENK